MVEKADNAPPAAPAYSEADKARARQWFKKAADCRERREYDYAIECFITGLGYWPEAVEEGHMPLRSVAVQRQQAGGKKPGFMDSLKKPMTGKDARRAMLNAEQLLSLDPQNVSYAEGMLKNAVKGGYLEAAKFVAPIVFDLLRRDKKPNVSRFQSFRGALVEGAQLASQRGESGMETWMLQQAVESIEYVAARLPGNDVIRNEVRDLAGRLTIARGKYEQADTFRESLHEAEKQKILHDSERIRQGEQTLEALIAAARAEYEANPLAAAKINAYVDVLTKPERDAEDKTAVEVLQAAYTATKNYSFKAKADDIRLRMERRKVEALQARAQKSGSEEDKQQARLAAMDYRQQTIAVFRERVEQYPTDLGHRYRLARALFETGEYDEAIPVLQVAQQDPRHRVRCQLMLGRAFFEKGGYAQAADVLSEALEKCETVDEFSKGLLYWQARSLEAAGRTEEAKAAYGKLLRQDYNYMDGDARRRSEALLKGA